MPSSSRSRAALAVAAIVLAGAGGALIGTWSADDEPPVDSAAADTARVPSPFETTLSRELATLAAERQAQLERLRAAELPGEQASAARGLRDAYRRAALTLTEVEVPPLLQAENRAAAQALGAVAGAYGRLAASAASANGSGYEAAREAVSRAESRSLTQLRATLDVLGGQG